MLALGLLGVASDASAAAVDFAQLPELPPAVGQTQQAGQAAPFAGVQGDALVVGGGANFPITMPWDGGTKVWWDDVFVLERFMVMLVVVSLRQVEPDPERHQSPADQKPGGLVLREQE